MYVRSSEELEAAPLDDDSINWNDVVEATYSVHQRFRYDYPAPIADLHHRLMLVPRARHGDQRRVASRLDVTPHAVTHDAQDAFGNPVTTIFARRIESAIEFSHWSIVTRRRDGVHRVDRSILADPALHSPTDLTASDAELRAVAKTLRLGGETEFALAESINAYVHQQMTYVAGSTDVETTASRAFEQRRGVCQDFAHVMIALARRCGLAARYVSGHLVGEGGTHAWVEILIADGSDALVLSYDPTHGCRVDMRYIVVAVGRDYTDVAPTSGVFTAPYPGEMTATKRVGATQVRYLA
jgi:transglutaminase-like putative cysteine protease